MNKILFIFVLIGIGGVLAAASFAPASVPQNPQDVREAKEYKLDKVQSSFFVGCRGAFDENPTSGRMADRLGLTLPETRDVLCACMVKEVGTPSDIRFTRITEKLIVAAISGRAPSNAKELHRAISRESIKAVVAGADQDELQGTLRSIMVARGTCARRLKEYAEG